MAYAFAVLFALVIAVLIIRLSERDARCPAGLGHSLRSCICTVPTLSETDLANLGRDLKHSGRIRIRGR